MNNGLHITVATILHRNDRFLMVEEECEGKLVINQPAGHVESGESLIEAAMRETLEETGWRIEIDSVVSLYRWQVPENGETYFRIAFRGQPLEHLPDHPLDTGIVRTLWMSAQELQAAASRLRSPLVMRGVSDFLKNANYPLDLIVDL